MTVWQKRIRSASFDDLRLMPSPYPMFSPVSKGRPSPADRVDDRRASAPGGTNTGRFRARARFPVLLLGFASGPALLPVLLRAALLVLLPVLLPAPLPMLLLLLH